MTRTATRTTAIGLALAGVAAAAVGCGKTRATEDNTGAGETTALLGNQRPAPSQVPAGPGPGAGGAPTFGEPTGTGFYTLDAAHGTGQGSGMLGWHGTGKMGTSAAISDAHPAGEPPKNAPQWVLPEQ